MRSAGAFSSNLIRIKFGFQPKSIPLELYKFRRLKLKFKNPFSTLTCFEWILLSVSLIAVTLSFLLSPATDYMSLFASLIGVTALIFIAKGMAFGQLLVIIFAILYGIISYRFAYYGEMITYLLLSAPAALLSLIAWIMNPYEESDTVKVRTYLSLRTHIILILLTVAVTVGSYFLLDLLGTANLIFSTLSVMTSFYASALTFLRSPFYALAYAGNDLVLIVLWALAAIEDISYLPMIFCFIMFLVNDSYGFFNWKRLERAQAKN